jgi:hypothetical protein
LHRNHQVSRHATNFYFNLKEIIMIKMSHLLAALLFASVSSAYAADTLTQPTSQGSTSVKNQLDSPNGASVNSGGNADQGLNTAQTNITKEHDRTESREAEHAATPDQPAVPDHPSAPDHPSVPDHPSMPDHPAGR